MKRMSLHTSPKSFREWAAGLSSSLQRTERGWIADTPGGKATVRFSEPNQYGVLDHWVRVDGQPEIYIPMRLIANGNSTEVELVLFRQPGMSDADFDRDTGLVKRDLSVLKTLLERRR